MILPSLEGNNGENVGAADLHEFYQVGQLAGEATSPAFQEESGTWIKNSRLPNVPSRRKEHLNRGLVWAGSGSRRGAGLGQTLGIFRPEGIS